MSRFPDPEPTSAFPASLARGRLHALIGADPRDAARVEALVRPRLATLVARWGHRIESPRATGYALAFDVKDGPTMNAYLEQRFWRGAIVFGAGSRTIRYRLNASFGEREIDLLFEAANRSLAWLEAHPGKTPPAWEDLPAPSRPSAHARTTAAPAASPTHAPAIRVRVAAPDEADALMPEILALEARAYEPARRDEESHLRLGFAPDAVAIVAELVEGERTSLVGSALATPLEEVAYVQGPDRDPMRGRGNTLYSIAITVDPAHHGRGLGRLLKEAQLRRAAELRRADGGARYRHVSGRNRIPDAGAMCRLNDAFGAYTVFELEGQYEGAGVARYYRQPVGAFAPDPVAQLSRERPAHDLASGLARPFAEPPASLRALWETGGLYGPSVTKLTVLNYLTPAVVRAAEWVGALTPSHPHAYLCSGRDETVDKSVRVLRWHRKEGQVVIGFEGGYVGHTTACARSISDPAVHRQGPAHFAWPRVPHPAKVGVEASITALRDAIAAAGGPSRVLGIYLEPVQERTGLVAPGAFYAALAALREETGVPVVFVETTSAYYRSGRGAFASSGIEALVPDASIWWTGGQLGFVHVTSALYVATPLTLVSTWDGDELSLVQMHHQLRAARKVDVRGASEALDGALAGVSSSGLGLYRVIDAGERAASLEAALRARGVRVRVFAGGKLALSPALDRAEAQARALGEALRASR
jgi:4-aminobutyrate aminotransferase-like enzyme/GNAT superfamily N-acetyltransferase